MNVTVLREGELEIHLASGMRGRRFDGADHGLSHCMKAVDFVVETAKRMYFIEVKDPEHRDAPLRNREDFIDRFLSGNLDDDLVRKYRDSFLYQWAARDVRKPIAYIVLLAFADLDDALLLERTDALRRSLPLQGPSGGVWKETIAASCNIFNLESFNRTMGDLRVARVPAHT